MKKFFLPAVGIAVSIYFLFSYFVKDVTINRYEDYQTVQEQNATEQGWVPALLPASAYDIAETHDMKKHEIFGLFHYKEPDEAALLSQLTVTKEDNQTMGWGDFLFHVDREKNIVKYRNNPALSK